MRLAQVLVALDVDDVVARHHHLAGDGVAELEDGVDHLALAGLDQRRRLGEVDQLAQLGLGRERALAEALARRDRVADQDQQPGAAARGPRSRAASGAGRDSATRSECWRPTVRGATPMATKETTSMTRDRGQHAGPPRRRRTPVEAWTVTSTIAEISHSSRRKQRGVEVARRVVEQRDQAAWRPAARRRGAPRRGPGRRTRAPRRRRRRVRRARPGRPPRAAARCRR